MATYLRNLRLDELSFVDNPANKGARIALFKRADDIEKVIRQEGDKWVIYSEDGSKKLGTFASKEEAVARLRQIEGHKHAGDPGDLSKTGDDVMTLEELKKQVGELAAQVTTLTAANTDLTKQVADLTKERDELKKGADDEVIQVGETTIRKSKVGAETFDAIKAQQVMIDVERNRREEAEFSKKAETSYGHLPGTAVEKAKVLRFIEGAPEELKKTFGAMLAAGEKAMVDIMRPIPGGGYAPPSGGSMDKMDQLVKAYRDKHNVSEAVAYDQVLKTAEGAQLYKEYKEERATVAH